MISERFDWTIAISSGAVRTYLVSLRDRQTEKVWGYESFSLSQAVAMLINKIDLTLRSETVTVNHIVTGDASTKSPS